MSVTKCHVGDLKKSSTAWNGLALSVGVVSCAATMVQKGTLPPQADYVEGAPGASV